MEFVAGEIMALSQEGTIKDYCDSFEALFNKGNIDEGYAIYLFISGLKPEIGDVFVQWHQHRLQTLKDIFSLALKLDSNKLKDTLSPDDPYSSEFIKVESVHQVFDETPKRYCSEIQGHMGIDETPNMFENDNSMCIKEIGSLNQYLSIHELFDSDDSKENEMDNEMNQIFGSETSSDMSESFATEGNIVESIEGDVTVERLPLLLHQDEKWLVANSTRSEDQMSGLKDNLSNEFNRIRQETMQDVVASMDFFKPAETPGNDSLYKDITTNHGSDVDNENKTRNLKKVNKGPVHVDHFYGKMVGEVSQIAQIEEDKSAHSVLGRNHRIALKDKDKEAGMIKTKKTSQLGSELMVAKAFEWKPGWCGYLGGKMRNVQHYHNEYVVVNSIAVRNNELEYLNRKIVKKDLFYVPSNSMHSYYDTNVKHLNICAKGIELDEFLTNVPIMAPTVVLESDIGSWPGAFFDIKLLKFILGLYGGAAFERVGHMDLCTDFYAVLRRSYNGFIKDLEKQCKQVIQQHLDSVTRPYTQVCYLTDLLFRSSPNFTFSYQKTCLGLSDQENIRPINKNSKKKAMAHMWHKWKSKFPFLIMIVNGYCSNRLAKMYMWHRWKSKLWFRILTPYGRFFIITSDELPCFDMVNLTKWLMGLGNNKKIEGFKKFMEV